MHDASGSRGSEAAMRALKPPALPSRLVSTVPGLGWLHMLQVLRRAQLVLPQPLQVQSPSAKMPVQAP